MILLGQMVRSATSFSNVIRQRALAALAQSNEPGVMTFVSQLLERTDPFLRQLGTAALARVNHEQSVELLAKMIVDGDELFRQTAVCARSAHR